MDLVKRFASILVSAVLTSIGVLAGVLILTMYLLGLVIFPALLVVIGTSWLG